MSIVTLSDAKAWLRFPNPDESSADDSIIQNLIDAAQDLIESRIGICVPQVFDRYLTPNGCKIWLPESPVLEVMSVTESFGAYSWNLAFQQPDTGPIVDGTGSESSNPVAGNVFAYSLDVPETGEITARTVANSLRPFYPSDHGVRVIWQAGRTPIPAGVQIAAKELVAHAYQNALQRSVSLSGANVVYDATAGTAFSRDDSGDGSMTYWIGVPFRVLSWLEAEKIKLPIIA